MRAVVDREKEGVYLLDCYDVIGDTDAKTEGTLQARFERAADCSPCILLLRHIDAFAQSTQAQEPGKGTFTHGNPILAGY